MLQDMHAKAVSIDEAEEISVCVRKQTIWVPTRSDTNRAVQSQKMVICGNFGIHEAKTKALISFAVTAKLICAFVIAHTDCWGFPCGGSNQLYNGLESETTLTYCDKGITLWLSSDEVKVGNY